MAPPTCFVHSPASLSKLGRRCGTPPWSSTTKRQSGRAAPRAALRPDAEGRVPVATPFGCIRRDPLMLPPMVSLAFDLSQRESEEELAKRLQELAPILKAKNTRQTLAALQELTFFPPRLATSAVLECVQNSADELVRSQSSFLCALYVSELVEESGGDLELSAEPLFQLVVNLLSIDDSPTVRSAAAGALGLLRGTPVLKALERSLVEEKDWLVRMSASVSLGTLGDERAIPALTDTLKSFDPGHVENDSLVIQGLIGALGQLGSHDSISFIIPFGKSNDMLVRQQVAEALQAFTDERVILTLQTLMEDDSPVVATQARHSLEAVKKRLAS